MIEPVALLLIELGAREIDHPGGTLLAHLHRVHDLLADWGARPALQLAGLGHACYGTDGFAPSLLSLDERDRLVAVVGAEAEAIAYRYASCDRSYTYAHLVDDADQFRDRFAGVVTSPTLDQRRDFAELTAANELDLVRVNPELRERYGPGLRRLFTRLRPLLSEAARRACDDGLPPADASERLR
ncbi:hypothetical protein F4553_002555 [Allocatelliglobosispora scoriae]|uniref:DUF6817 domain-containing protein n=1 Tax=Allocatelliglobosispora scoriae TaxID=643052 RepID=A0A841BPE4_9ACTN|nr:hypothetical protein [Allocatelliglobosispora scoriae]MBB5869176.1 hypothetical protein [Allocatelliglobosispora scoriae]